MGLTPFEHFIEEGKLKLETEMKTLFKTKSIPSRLQASMLYSLLAGGKRLRPILLMASFETFHPGVNKALRSAIALEMVHTYSLIHDDLPAMDNDDYRRGHLTNHKKFDEATAILAGDALLTYSIQYISEDPLLSDQEKVFVIQSLTAAGGPEGMVAGQVLDMEGEKQALTLEQMELIHQQKTGQLILFAVNIGAYLAGVPKEQRYYLQQYAHYLGLIFQVQDDILDIVGDAEKLGKPIGSDLANEKSTYPSLLGLDGAKRQKEMYVSKATEALHSAGTDESHLLDMLHYFSQRDH